MQPCHVLGRQALLCDHSVLMGLKFRNEIGIREEVRRFEARSAIRGVVQLRWGRQVYAGITQDIEHPVPTLRFSEAHVLIERRPAKTPREPQLACYSQ